MKVIIAGSRTIEEYAKLRTAIDLSNFKITEIVSGGALGVDGMGMQWADKYEIPLKIFKPNWAEHGKAAGPIRNREMAEYADALIAIWDGESRGTKNMIEEMEKRGKPCACLLVTPNGEDFFRRKNV